MKKIFTAIMAASIFCTTASSCSSIAKNKTSESTSDSSVSTDEVSELADSEQLLLINSYKYEEIPMPDGMKSVYDITPIKDTGEYIVQFADEKYNVAYFKTDSSFSQFTPFEPDIPSDLLAYDYCSYSYFFNNDGSFFAFVTTEDHGGIKPPDEYDENFDYETYNNNRIASYTLCSYDKNGTLISKTPINYSEEYFDDYDYLSIYSCGTNEGDFIQSLSNRDAMSNEGVIVTIDTNGNPEKHIAESNTEKINIGYAFLKDSEGKTVIYETYSEIEKDDQGMECYTMSFNLRMMNSDYTLGEPFFSLSDFGIDGGAPSPGTGDYKMYMSMTDGLFGIKDDGSMTQIINWNESGVEPMQAYCVGENEFIGINSPVNSNESTLVRLTPRDPSEFANKKVITIANIDNYYPTAEIYNFNNSQSEYHVQTLNYALSDDYEQNLKQLNLDLISDNVPDIIYGLPYNFYLNYQNKGVFADLSQFIENDSEVNRNTIMPNVLKAIESGDGKIYNLCTAFSIKSLVAKTRVFDKENWTFDEMLDLYENAPPEAIHIYDGETKSDMFRAMFFTMNDLIDYKNATCDFNNQQVIQMLEFCNRFVNEIDMPDKESDPEGHQGYYTDKHTWLKNDQILVTPVGFSNGFTAFDSVKYLEGGGEDLTFVGYPTNNGKGGRLIPEGIMAVTESSKNKEGAWEFIKNYIIETSSDFSDEYSYGLPILTDAFNKALDAEMSAEHTASGMEIPSLTQKDRDMIYDYVLQCDSLGTVFDLDLELLCNEEANIYFAGGQTAEETAEHIQNRASILISEKS